MFRNLFLSLSRMPPFLMLLVICGLAVTATMLYMGQQDKSRAELERVKSTVEADQKRTTTVLKAAKIIEIGEVFSQDNTKSEDIPEKALPLGGVQSLGAVAGNVAKVQINQGDVILNSFVTQQAVQAKGFDARIKEGMRAVTFAIDTNSGVAGFIYPESRVDILCITGSGAEVKAAPVLSDVEVVAVGGQYEKPKGDAATAQAASSVTVLLSPDDSEKLVKSVTAGRPYLVLRNSKDHTPVATVDIAALFPKPKVEESTDIASSSLPAPSLPPPPLPGGGGSPVDAGPAAPPPPPPMHEIELWSGSKKEVLSVPQG